LRGEGGVETEYTTVISKKLVPSRRSGMGGEMGVGHNPQIF